LKNKSKLAFLCVLLIVFALPPLHFLIYEYPHSSIYIWQLFRGQASVGFDVSGDRCGIVSHIMYGFTDFALSYMVLVIGSGVAFCICLALLIIVSYSVRKVKPDCIQPVS
jgi:hypothetical protein